MLSVLIGISLEAVGFILGWLGVRYPAMDRQLEDWVDDSEELTEQISYAIRNSMLTQGLFSLGTLLALTMGVSWLLNTLIFPWYLWVLFWLVCGSCAFIVILHLVPDYVRFLNWLGRGKAVSAFGLNIGLISMLIEAWGLYQVLFVSLK